MVARDLTDFEKQLIEKNQELEKQNEELRNFVLSFSKCGNCRHEYLKKQSEECIDCNGDNSKWMPKEKQS